jgi:hypothetical protein
MAGLVPAIHVFVSLELRKKDVDARHKAGHDEGMTIPYVFFPILPSVPACNRLMFSRCM